MNATRYILLAALIGGLYLPASALPAELLQDAPGIHAWLDQLAQRMETRRSEATRKAEKAGATLRKAESLLAKAKAAGNPTAAAAATKATENARKTQKLADAQRQRAESLLAALKTTHQRAERASIGAAVLYRSGTIEVQQGEQWVPLSEEPLLAPGTTLRTGPESWIRTELPDGSKISIGPESNFTVEKLPDGWRELDQLLHLGAGKLKASVIHSLKKKFEVRAGSGTCSVRGTVFRVHQTESGAAVFAVEEGVVEVTDLQGNGKIEIKAGFSVEVPPDGLPGEPQPFSAPNRLEPWEEENE